MITSKPSYTDLEQRLEVLEKHLNRMSDASLVYDLSMNIEFMNEGAEVLLRRKKELLLGKNLWQEFPEKQDSPLAAAFTEAIITQKPVVIEAENPAHQCWYTHWIYPSPEGISEIVNRIDDRSGALYALEKSERWIRAMLEGLPDGINVADLETRSFIFSNQNFQQMLGYTAEEVLSLSLEDLHPPEDMPRIHAEFEGMLRGETLYTKNNRIRRKDGTEILADIKAVILNLDGRQSACGIFTDVTQRNKAELIQRAQAAITEKISQDNTLEDILTEIVISIEKLGSGTIASIILLDEDGIHIRKGAAPNLPDAYNEAIEGAAIGPNAGSCGTCMYRKEPVFVTDIDLDPLWADYLALAQSFGLRSCWSTPILDGRGKVLGSFALYDTKPGAPTEADFDLIATATHLASLAIEKSQREQVILKAKAEAEDQELILKEAQKIGKIGHWVMDLQTNALVWSNETYSIFGVKPEDTPLSYEYFLQFVHPEDRERVNDIFGQHVKTGEDYRLVHRIVTPEGTVRTVHARSITTLGEEGKPIRSFGVVGDISEIKAAEKALIESERKNRTLFENMSQGVIYYDHNGVATRVNPACLSILGLTEEQVLKFDSFHNKWTLVKPDGQPYAEDEDRVVFQAIRTKKPIENKTIGLLDKETNKCTWLMVSVVPEFREEEEDPFQVFATFTDITDQKRAEEALRDSELRYRSIFEVSPVGIAILQQEQIVFINPAGMEMLGVKSSREFFEKSVFGFIHPDYIEKANQLSAGLRAGGKGLFPTEITLLDANGGTFDVELSVSFLQYNHAPAFQVIATDITERKKYLRATEAQNKILKDIAWTQSHVVRAPLATMMGLVNLLEMEDYTAFSHRDILGLISMKANELDQVIRNISDKAFTVSMIEMENEENLISHSSAEDVFTRELLLVDDDPLMQKLHTSIAIRNKLHPEPKTFMNGKTALDFILNHNTPEHMHLVWLDINMPVMNGWEFLESLNQHAIKCSVHVMILSSSVDMADRIKAQQYPQVIDYFTKPITRHTVQSMLTHPKLKGIWI